MNSNAYSQSPNELPSLSTSLLGRVQAMQPTAWAQLVEVFSPIVYRWARQSGLSAADSSDIVQDVFVSLAKRIGDFQRQKEVGSFRSWLATITRNRIRDCFRAKNKQATAEGGTEAMQRMARLPLADLDQQLENSVSLEQLEQSIPKQMMQLVRNDCDLKTWQAFWLTTVHGDAAADVAERLEMGIASVYQAKTRILRRLRTLLADLP